MYSIEFKQMYFNNDFKNILKLFYLSQLWIYSFVNHAQLTCNLNSYCISCSQGRRKHQKIGEGGGTGFQGNFWILKKLLPKKFKEPRGEGERNIFPSYHTKIARFWSFNVLDSTTFSQVLLHNAVIMTTVTEAWNLTQSFFDTSLRTLIRTYVYQY
jgi:hypothetical protein